MLQDYEKFKRGKEVPQEAKFNTSNSIYRHKLSQTLVQHKHVMHDRGQGPRVAEGRIIYQIMMCDA
jgi:hypothetical protein